MKVMRCTMVSSGRVVTTVNLSSSCDESVSVPIEVKALKVRPSTAANDSENPAIKIFTFDQVE